MTTGPVSVKLTKPKPVYANKLLHKRTHVHRFRLGPRAGRLRIGVASLRAWFAKDDHAREAYQFEVLLGAYLSAVRGCDGDRARESTAITGHGVGIGFGHPVFRFRADLARADWYAKRVKYAFRADSARRARSAGSRMPSGSTSISKRRMLAALAGAVLAVRSASVAHEA